MEAANDRGAGDVEQRPGIRVGGVEEDGVVGAAEAAADPVCCQVLLAFFWPGLIVGEGHAATYMAARQLQNLGVIVGETDAAADPGWPNAIDLVDDQRCGDPVAALVSNLDLPGRVRDRDAVTNLAAANERLCAVAGDPRETNAAVDRRVLHNDTGCSTHSGQAAADLAAVRHRQGGLAA